MERPPTRRGFYDDVKENIPPSGVRVLTPRGQIPSTPWDDFEKCCAEYKGQKVYHYR